MRIMRTDLISETVEQIETLLLSLRHGVNLEAELGLEPWLRLPRLDYPANPETGDCSKRHVA